MLMMRARVQGHRWVDHPAAAVMEARVPGQWVDRPAAVVMEAREQGRCWIDHPAAAVMEARVQGRHWVDRPSLFILHRAATDVFAAHTSSRSLQSPVQSAPMDITVSSNFDQHESHPKTLLHIRNIYLTHVEEEERRKIGWITCFNIPLGLLL
ncbi:hypothetical protein ACOMHN_000342 [Nucella lapillus]